MEVPDTQPAANENEDDGGLASQLSHFVDRDGVVACINNICSAASPNEQFSSQFFYLFMTLGKYQEQPMLLASALPDMVDPLMKRLLKIIAECSIGDLKDADLPDAPTNPGLGGEGVAKLFLNRTYAKTLGRTFEDICKILQLICRVRGFKHVIKLFPHEVSQLEPCLFLLLAHAQASVPTPMATSTATANDSNTGPAWETRYILLLWLCILCLIPFDICSIDSTMKNITLTSDSNVDMESEDATIDTDKALPDKVHIAPSSTTKSALVRGIIDVCSNFLKDTGPTREAASSCLSSLLTRPGKCCEWISSQIAFLLDTIAMNI